MKRFLIQYKELWNNETLHTLEILNTGSASGTVYLTGAEVPFEWEEDNDTNLLSFLRTKTGKISIVVGPNDDIDGLLPTSPISHRVELDGVWIGYIEPTVFSIPMYSDVYKLKLNVMSRMSASDNNNVSFGGWNRVYIQDIMDNIAFADYYILPSGYTYERWFSQLRINPYRSDNDFKFDAGESLYEKITAYELLKELCNFYCFNVHEIPYGTGTTAYLFTAFNHSGNYLVYDIEDPETPTEITASELDFYNTFTLAGDRNKKQMIRPLKKVTLVDGNEMSSEQGFPFELSKYTGAAFIGGKMTYFLKPMASQLSSQYLRQQPSDYVLNDMNVIMCGRSDDDEGDPEECIYMMSVGTNVLILSATFYGLQNPERFTIEFEDIPDNLASGSYTFRYSIRCGGKYWDDDNAEWSSTENIYSQSVDPNNNKLNSIGFYTDNDNDGSPVIINLYSSTVEYHTITCKIKNITCYTYKSHGIPDKYNQDLIGRKELIGPAGADTETEVSSIFGIINTVANNLGYMFDNQTAITVEVVRRDITAQDYMRKWTFGSDPLKYRLISVQDSQRDSTMELLFIGCQTIS